MKIKFNRSYTSEKDWGEEPVVVPAVLRPVFFWS